MGNTCTVCHSINDYIYIYIIYVMYIILYMYYSCICPEKNADDSEHYLNDLCRGAVYAQ
jgi:hypothetical protein